MLLFRATTIETTKEMIKGFIITSLQPNEEIEGWQITSMDEPHDIVKKDNKTYHVIFKNAITEEEAVNIKGFDFIYT